MFNNVKASVLERNKFIIEKGHHDIDVLMIVLSGSLKVLINNTWVILKKNECVLFRKNQYFERKVIENLKIIYITLDITEERFFYQKNARLEIPKNRVAENIELFKTYPNFIEHIINDIIFYSFYSKTISTPNTADQILNYLKEHYQDEISLKDLAKAFYLSHSGLIYIIKQRIGQTPKNYLLSLRIEKAIELLLGSDLPICEIAIICGFKNEYYFSNAFKKRIGISPSYYRKKYKI